MGPHSVIAIARAGEEGRPSRPSPGVSEGFCDPPPVLPGQILPHNCLAPLCLVLMPHIQVLEALPVPAILCVCQTLTTVATR